MWLERTLRKRMTRRVEKISGVIGRTTKRIRWTWAIEKQQHQIIWTLTSYSKAQVSSDPLWSLKLPFRTCLKPIPGSFCKCQNSKTISNRLEITQWLKKVPIIGRNMYSKEFRPIQNFEKIISKFFIKFSKIVFKISDFYFEISRYFRNSQL